MRSWKLNRLGWLLAASLLLSACTGGSEESPFRGGDFEIVFSGKVGEKAFSCDEKYLGLGVSGALVMPQDFRFYVSDVRLLTKQNEEVPVELLAEAPWQTPEVALVDFENGTHACAKNGNPETNVRLTGSVPKGEYVGVVFSLSVPEELNHEDPALAPEPLQVTAMQWSWLMGYKFMRAEVAPMSAHDHGEGGAGGAASDHEAPDGHALDSQFHLGSLACQQNSCDKPNRSEIRFDSFNPETQTITADLAEIMKQVDLTLANHCHGAPHDACNSFYASVGLDYETGESTGEQSAFRVEER